MTTQNKKTMKTKDIKELQNRIANLDLEPIQFKLVHDDSDWTIERATKAANQYRKFGSSAEFVWNFAKEEGQNVMPVNGKFSVASLLASIKPGDGIKSLPVGSTQLPCDLYRPPHLTEAASLCRS